MEESRWRWNDGFEDRLPPWQPSNSARIAGFRKAEAKQSYEAALKLNPTLKEAPEALKRVS